MDAKELLTAPKNQVAPQLQTLLNLLCEDKPSIDNSFAIPTPIAWGYPQIAPVSAHIRSCSKLKRNIDVVLLSLGGNDVGFAAVDSIDSMIAYPTAAGASSVGKRAPAQK